MAIQVNPIVSPRIITIPAIDGPEIDIQSLVNQIRVWEATQVNMSYPRLLSAAGKEDLGGDVYVGITAKLENAKIMFEGRLTPTICKVTGGNLVAVNEFGVSMYPLEYSDNVMATITASSSATLQESTLIQQSSFENRVVIDSLNGVDGTKFPCGTHHAPVKTLAFAKLIAEVRGFEVILVEGSLDVLSGESISDYKILGHGWDRTDIHLNSGCITTSASFEDVCVHGVCNGGDASFLRCCIDEMEGMSGKAVECTFDDAITLDGDLTLINCVSSSVSSLAPIVTCVSPCNFIVRNHAGAIILKGIDDSSCWASLDFNSGRLTIDESCTDGTIVVRGICVVTDNHKLSCDVNTLGVVTPESVAVGVWDELQTGHNLDGSFSKKIKSIGDVTDQFVFTTPGKVDATVEGGAGAGLTPEEHTALIEIFQLYGLDPTKPLVVTPTLRQAGTIVQRITSKAKETKVQRQ